mgnify:CR=1 FL=1
MDTRSIRQLFIKLIKSIIQKDHVDSGCFGIPRDDRWKQQSENKAIEDLIDKISNDNIGMAILYKQGKEKLLI